jgi:hypothetical protein
MVVEMHADLASDDGSKLKMLLTFIDALPTGYIFLRFSLSLPRPTSSSLPLLVSVCVCVCAVVSPSFVASQ